MLSTVMLIFTIVLSVYIAICAIRGFFKGWKWSLIIFCRIFLAAVLAFAATKLLALSPAVNDLLLMIAGSAFDIEAAAIVSIASAIVNTLVLPFVFYIIFCILNLLLMIPAHFIKKAVLVDLGTSETIVTVNERKLMDAERKAALEAAESSSEDDGTKKTKLEKTEEEKARDRERINMLLNKFGGAAIRGSASLLSVMLLFFPTMALFYTFADGLILLADTAEEIDVKLNVGEESLNIMGYSLTDGNGDIDFEEVNDFIDDSISPVHENVYLKLSYSTPMKLLHSVIGAVPGSNILAGNEITQAFELVSDALYLTVELKDYDDEQKDAVVRISEYISKSEFHSGLAAELVSSAANTMLEDQSSSESEDAFASLFVPLLETLSDVTSDTISADFDTIGSLIGTMIDYDIFKTIGEGGDLISSFADEDFLYDILYDINENDNFREMIPSVLSLSMTAMTEQLGSAADQINIDFDMDEMSAEELKREAEIISLVLNDATTLMNAMSSESFELSEMGEELRTLGRTLDAAMDSALIGDSIKDIFIAILDSDMFGPESTEIAEIVKKHINTDDISLENLLVAIQEFTVILDNYSSSGTQDTAVLAESMRTLSSSFDESTTAILKEIINNTSIFSTSDESDGVVDDPDDTPDDDPDGTDSAAIDTMQTLMNVFVDTLASGEIEDDEYEEEAEALDYVMQIVGVAESDGTDGIKDIYGDSDGMNEMISSVIGAKITSAAINEIAYDDEGNLTPDALEIASGVDDDDIESLVNGCESYYIEEASKEDCDVELLETNLKAIASIFGEDISEDIRDWRKSVD